MLNIHSGQVGLSILNSMGLIGICQMGMHAAAETENHFTSVQRIIDYTKVPSEPPLESDAKKAPPNDWPQLGRVEFKSLSLRYDEDDGARILRNLTFLIEAKVSKLITLFRAPQRFNVDVFIHFINF